MDGIGIRLPTEAIRTFCRKWKIVELALFGSVLTDHFRADSDIDVLVEFEPGYRVGLRFFAMERELSETKKKLAMGGAARVDGADGVRVVGDIKLIARAVEGIDGIFIGPADLSASFGHLGNPQHPDMQKRIRKAEADIAEGRTKVTRSVEEAQALLDGSKSLKARRRGRRR